MQQHAIYQDVATSSGVPNTADAFSNLVNSSCIMSTSTSNGVVSSIASMQQEMSLPASEIAAAQLLNFGTAQNTVQTGSQQPVMMVVDSNQQLVHHMAQTHPQHVFTAGGESSLISTANFHTSPQHLNNVSQQQQAILLPASYLSSNGATGEAIYVPIQYSTSSNQASASTVPPTHASSMDFPSNTYPINQSAVMDSSTLHQQNVRPEHYVYSTSTPLTTGVPSVSASTVQADTPHVVYQSVTGGTVSDPYTHRFQSQHQTFEHNNTNSTLSIIDNSSHVQYQQAVPTAPPAQIQITQQDIDSGFAYFFKATQTTVSNHNPGAKLEDITKVVHSMWEALDMNERYQYVLKSREAPQNAIVSVTTAAQTLVNNSVVSQQQQQQSNDSSLESGGGGGSGSICIRSGCQNRSVVNVEWEGEYCSNACVVAHCRDIFARYVINKKTKSGGSSGGVNSANPLLVSSAV